VHYPWWEPRTKHIKHSTNFQSKQQIEHEEKKKRRVGTWRNHNIRVIIISEFGVCIGPVLIFILLWYKLFLCEACPLLHRQVILLIKFSRLCGYGFETFDYLEVRLRHKTSVMPIVYPIEKKNISIAVLQMNSLSSVCKHPCWHIKYSVILLHRLYL
jgi:hypothetical protein